MEMNKGLKFKFFLMCGLLATSLASHAALFDDKEARKKILELESKSQANDEAHQAAINDLKKTQASIEKRIAAIEAVIQSQGLLELQNQIEAMKQEIAQLKGDLEVASHNLEAAQQRQKDLYTDTDTRLRRIEAGPVSTAPDAATPSTPPVAPVEESICGGRRVE